MSKDNLAASGKPKAQDGAAHSDVDPKSDEIKHFVLDTNVLLHNPDSVFSFKENLVVIPFAVIEELDTFKKNNDETGRHARHVIRHLDALRARGWLGQGVKWNGGGGMVMVDMADYEAPGPLSATYSVDNRIITVAYQHKKAGNRTIFISKDLNARIKADALGIETQDFEAQKVDTENLFAGYRIVDAPGEVIDRLYSQKEMSLEDLAPHLNLQGDDGLGPVLPNEYILLQSPVESSKSALARRRGDHEKISLLAGTRKPVFGILGRNVQQTMALDLLMDDDVKMVTMHGTAGTGKTLLALAAGMAKVIGEGRYDRLLVARPIMPLGRDIGFLPGDKDEKLHLWMQPIFDNLTYLLSTRGAAGQQAESRTSEQRINALLADEKIVLEPLTYIRGRSIPNQFMIVDEAQNLTPHEVKTIASRVGEGTKLVLTGDIQQIDNPYLDSGSNGLSYAAERLKGQSIVGHITLMKSERSTLASLVVNSL